MSDVPEAQLRDPPRPVPAEEGEGTARTLSVHGRRVRVGGGTREQGRPHGQLPEKPWHCRYCSFSALREAAEEHTRGCERFPVACPNGCGVGQVHRYLLPQHLTECPLQVVRCAYAHVGCSVQLPRSEMAAHTENSAQQHTLMVFGV